MIITENYKLGERDFIRTYSDSNRYVVRDGIEYSEACDPAEFSRQYTEGDIMTPEELTDENQEKVEAFDIIFGGAE